MMETNNKKWCVMRVGTHDDTSCGIGVRYVVQAYDSKKAAKKALYCRYIPYCPYVVGRYYIDYVDPDMADEEEW